MRPQFARVTDIKKPGISIDKEYVNVATLELVWIRGLEFSHELRDYMVVFDTKELSNQRLSYEAFVIGYDKKWEPGVLKTLKEAGLWAGD